ncbi:MAG: hypothetical protein KAS32_17765 [Candidatus Peribacteraceae bacterium]|nr:hypothetical protein [Candidatus Peribacteraceae bacterium]
MSWIQLYNSEFYAFTGDVNVDNISIHTIAHSLAHQCRYNGHCNKFMSVAEHSIYVANRVDDLSDGNSGAVMYALLHDASEAILCDIPTPIKRLPGAEWYRELEKKIQAALVDRFMGSYSIEAVRMTEQADLEMLATEKEQIMSAPPHDWGSLPEPLEVEIQGWPPRRAEQVFLELYGALDGGYIEY